MRENYREDLEFYKILSLSKKISELLWSEQERLGLNQIQMAQKLDMPLRTYKRLSSPNNHSALSSLNINKILVNSNITYEDIYKDIFTKSG